MDPVGFYKMTGSGNDFVVLDGRLARLGDWSRERIAAACDRRTGIGADGFVVLAPDTGGVRMHFYNADGGRADMCGNAALCSTRLAVRLGIARPEAMRLVTDAGILETRCLGPGDMAEIRLSDGPAPVELPGVVLQPGERWCRLGTVGVPHLVIRVDDIEAVDVERRGAELRHHPATGPAGANANFISPPSGPREPWLIRTFERGVEGETLACGTGTVAAALALDLLGEAPLPLPFRSRGGAPLAVSGRMDGGMARDVWLCGQGRLVFSGTYQPLD